MPVSYTHLDVYKRQGLHSTEGHHPHTAGTAEGDLLTLRGLHGLPLLPPVSYTHLVGPCDNEYR